MGPAHIDISFCRLSSLWWRLGLEKHINAICVPQGLRFFGKQLVGVKIRLAMIAHQHSFAPINRFKVVRARHLLPEL